MSDVICSTVASTLDEMELHYEQNGECFSLTVSDDGADFMIRIIADEKNELLTAIGYFPVKISKANLDKMYKVINDLNYHTIMGSFIIDSDDGELIFRLANNVDGGIINGSIVRMCLFQVFLCLQQSYEDIMKAMYGGPQMTFTFASEDRPSRAS